MLVPEFDGSHFLFAEAARAAEDRGQRVIVGGRQRIELVVVAATAADRHPEKRPSQRVNLFVDDVHLQLPHVRLGEHPRADREEPGRGEVLDPLGFARGGQQVSGKLLDEELVERLVGVERVHDVVAITPRVAIRDVLVQSVGVRVASHIQPVPPPSFTVLRRREQPLDDAIEGVGRFIRDKLINVVRRRREAGQVKRDSAQKRSLVGGRSGCEAPLFQLGQNECIDRRPHPVDVLHSGQRGVRDGSQRPELAALVDVDDARTGRGGGKSLARIGCTHLHPGFEVAHLRVAERSLRWHLQIAVLVPDRFDKATLLGITRDEDRSRIAPLQQRGARVEGQSSLGLLPRTVTLVTVLNKQRPDALLEELNPLGRRRRSRAESRAADSAGGEQQAK